MTTGSTTVDEQLQQGQQITRYVGIWAAVSVCGALLGLCIALLGEPVSLLNVRRFALGGLAVPSILVFVGGMAYLLQRFVYALERKHNRDYTGDGLVGEPQVRRVGMARAPEYPQVQYRDSSRAYDVRDVDWFLARIWPADGVSIEGYKPPAATSFVGKMPPSGTLLGNYAADVQPFFDACYGLGLITNWGEGKTYHLARTLPYARRAWQE